MKWHCLNILIRNYDLYLCIYTNVRKYYTFYLTTNKRDEDLLIDCQEKYKAETRYCRFYTNKSKKAI